MTQKDLPEKQSQTVLFPKEPQINFYKVLFQTLEIITCVQAFRDTAVFACKLKIEYEFLKKQEQK